jgi:high-affinity iron transporter
LWSLLAVARLAVLREGGETTLFYMGMAPSIDPIQLFLGIGGALVALLILGFAMIRFSVKIPVRPFFITATALIYYLVFKFLGESIHALQIAGKVPSHGSPALWPIDWLGIYPTWETTLPQLAVPAVLLIIVLRKPFERWLKRAPGNLRA